jgi:DNA-directed RNA polymerase sigma subunit (sigma70/sigma32)
MAKRDPQRTERLRIAVRYMLEHDTLQPGSQSRLAEHFNVSRQRVHQIVVEERQALGMAPPADPARRRQRAS